jgi:hypothetical protein
MVGDLVDGFLFRQDKESDRFPIALAIFFLSCQWQVLGSARAILRNNRLKYLTSHDHMTMCGITFGTGGYPLQGNEVLVKTLLPLCAGDLLFPHY